jgi:uncharacterized protein (DUF1697 family)
MSRSVAFLRAINVGGRTVRMDRLKTIFEGAGLADVATFIASGNVLFDSGRSRAKSLEPKLERHLKDALGYDVETFIRTGAELERIAACDPFPEEEPKAGGPTLYVAFMRSPISPSAQRDVAALSCDTDQLVVVGAQTFWLCRGRSSDSAISGSVLEKLTGSRLTVRNINTVNRLLDRIG